MPNSLLESLRADQEILDKIQISEIYAQNMYAALCNNTFQQLDMIEMLKDVQWRISWRGADQIISELSNGKNRVFYTSGYGMPSNDLSGMQYEERNIHFSLGYVCEGTITPEITEDLFRIGWKKI